MFPINNNNQFNCQMFGWMTGNHTTTFTAQTMNLKWWCCYCIFNFDMICQLWNLLFRIWLKAIYKARFFDPASNMIGMIWMELCQQVCKLKADISCSIAYDNLNNDWSAVVELTNIGWLCKVSAYGAEERRKSSAGRDGVQFHENGPN